MKLSEIAARLCCELIGNPDLEISGLTVIEDAQPNELTFLSNKKYLQHVGRTRAGAIIIADAALLPEGMSAIISTNPYLTFAEALWLFHPRQAVRAEISPHAIIAESTQIGRNVSIGAFTVIGEKAVIGDNTVIGSHCAVYNEAIIGSDSYLYSHCIVRERCRLGARVILQNGVIIGGDGFGFAQRDDKSWFKIPQTGIVVIEDDVEIGAGSTIDRATIGETVVARGTKLDNLVHIGHGCTIGENTLLCAQVGLAGSTRVGKNVILGGQTGAAGHLTIGDGAIAIAQTGIPSSVEPGAMISGSPAIPSKDWMKSSALYARLPKLVAELRELKQKLRALEDWITQRKGDE